MKKFLMKFDKAEDARTVFCIKQGFKCEDCPLFYNKKIVPCNDLTYDFPDIAAELMGLRVIDEEDK